MQWQSLAVNSIYIEFTGHWSVIQVSVSMRACVMQARFMHQCTIPEIHAWLLCFHHYLSIWEKRRNHPNKKENTRKTEGTCVYVYLFTCKYICITLFNRTFKNMQYMWLSSLDHFILLCFNFPLYEKISFTFCMLFNRSSWKKNL